MKLYLASDDGTGRSEMNPRDYIGNKLVLAGLTAIPVELLAVEDTPTGWMLEFEDVTMATFLGHRVECIYFTPESR